MPCSSTPRAKRDGYTLATAPAGGCTAGQIHSRGTEINPQAGVRGAEVEVRLGLLVFAQGRREGQREDTGGIYRHICRLAEPRPDKRKTRSDGAGIHAIYKV